MKRVIKEFGRTQRWDQNQVFLNSIFDTKLKCIKIDIVLDIKS